ncbi:DMT family transporter [Christiangramia salexigens]|uniref:EamA family transporter n=1 Tax=Christiangramia salexigens TaxID=1913577 RepID=A0A1L3J284_9FLAO|nr:DMT family transporter [Christiangramia salexigens]APG59218.1 EamA family transporter [Christiangramia salexigens]
MSNQKQHIINILQLNLAVLLISTSGVLGRYITLPPTVTIFYRTLIASIVFYAFCKWKGISLRIHSGNDWFRIVTAGLFMGVHWITYFYSLQLSNVAIALIALFTYPVMTAFLEPLWLGSKFDKIHLLLALLVLGGIYFLSPNMDLENNYFLAVILGIISALFYASRNLLMKPAVDKYDGTSLMFYQISVILICLLPVVFWVDVNAVLNQWKPIVTLAILTTCLGHTLFLKSFKNFSVTAASIMSSMQPVYGIILGLLFLNEVPALKTVLGGGLIISAVVIESLISIKKAR